LKFPAPPVSSSLHPPPPPPPPDTYLVDEAYEASRERGKGKSSVASNAANVGKYMGQLQKYLEVNELPGTKTSQSYCTLH
jgi:hypothetical protein